MRQKYRQNIRVLLRKNRLSFHNRSVEMHCRSVEIDRRFVDDCRSVEPIVVFKVSICPILVVDGARVLTYVWNVAKIKIFEYGFLKIEGRFV